MVVRYTFLIDLTFFLLSYVDPDLVLDGVRDTEQNKMMVSRKKL